MNGKHKCDFCHKNPATFHLTEITNGVQKEIHLCDKCYHDKAGIKQFSLADLLSGLSKVVDETDDTPQKTCPTCGMSFQEFQNRGRFGCGEDYKVFEDEIAPMLERIHGASEHRGKIPHQQGKDLLQQNEVRELERELKKAIAAENYEKAAKIRDDIKELKDKAQHQAKTQSAE